MLTHSLQAQLTRAAHTQLASAALTQLASAAHTQLASAAHTRSSHAQLTHAAHTRSSHTARPCDSSAGDGNWMGVHTSMLRPPDVPTRVDLRRGLKKKFIMDLRHARSRKGGCAIARVRGHGRESRSNKPRLRQRTCASPELQPSTPSGLLRIFGQNLGCPAMSSWVSSIKGPSEGGGFACERSNGVLAHLRPLPS